MPTQAPTRAPTEAPSRAPARRPFETPDPDRHYNPERLCPAQKKDGGHRTMPSP